MYDPGPLRGQGEPSRCELAKFVIHPDVERNERGLAAHRHQLEAGRGSRAGCGGVVRSGSTTWPSAVDSTGDRKAPILLKKSGAGGLQGWLRRLSVETTRLSSARQPWLGPSVRPICAGFLLLIDAPGYHACWPRFDQLGQLAKVLCDRGEQELVCCARRAAQSKAIEPEDALEMGEQHLNLLPLAT